MAVMKVKVVSMIGRMSELEAVTQICGKSCVFHPDNSLSFYSDTSDFSPLNEDNPFAEPLERLSDAVNGTGISRLKLLSERETEGFSMTLEETNRYVDEVCAAFSDLQDKREDIRLKAQSYKKDIQEFSHFVGLELNLDQIRECKYIKVRFGYLPKESFEKLKSYNQNPYIIFFPCTTDDLHHWGVYFAPIELVSEVDRIFSSLYFERVRLSELTGSPELCVEHAKEMLSETEKELHAIDTKLDALWKTEATQCLKVFSWLTERSVYFGIRRYAARYNDNFILTGWIPADEEEMFRNRLDLMDSVEYTFDGGEQEMAHSPPVKLKNARPFRPFEFFVDLYGLPSYDEVDPTPFVAITYFLLFGIMFGDLGQGLCVSIVGWLMWHYKKMALGKILIPCGVSAAIFGLVFGSVFGYENALDGFYKLLGFAEKPLDVMEPETTNLIILAAVAIGILLVLVAIAINIFSCMRRHQYENGLFGPNGLAGFIFYGALVVGFGGQLAFGWNIVTPAYVVCLIVLPLLVIYMREVLGGLVERRPDWKPENWGGYLVQNFFEVFEFLLGYASNTISFLRVGAFVLVHAGMMTVVFTLANMSSGIMYVLIVIIGNVFIMALEGLLVGIQVLRLEFYEMFSRFFDGAGRPFRPVMVRGES